MLFRLTRVILGPSFSASMRPAAIQLRIVRSLTFLISAARAMGAQFFSSTGLPSGLNDKRPWSGRSGFGRDNFRESKKPELVDGHKSHKSDFSVLLTAGDMAGLIRLFPV